VTTKATRKTTNEVVKKEAEDEQCKKDEEARNDDASPMGTEIADISTTGARGHT